MGRATAVAAKVPWSDGVEDQAARVVGRLMERQLWKFDAFPQCVEGDLVADAIDRVRDRYAAWDPARCGFSTFVYRTARSSLFDRLRKESRRAGREAEAVRERPAMLGRKTVPDGRGFLIELLDPDAAGGGEVDAAGWLAAVRSQIRRGASAAGVPAGARGGRRPGHQSDVSDEQRLAIAVFVRRQKLTTRGAEFAFGHRRDLREAAGLRRPLSRQFFVTLPKSDTQIRQLARRIMMSPHNAGGPGVSGEGCGGKAMDREHVAEWTMTPEEAAACLGVKVSTLATWRRDKRHLPFRRVGTRVHYRPDDVRAFSKRCEVAVAATTNN